MKHQILAALAILLESVSANAKSPANYVRLSQIPPEIQQCLVLASAPDHRSLVKMILDPNCYNALTEEQKNLAIQVITTIQTQNFAGVPEFTRGG